MLSLLKAQRKGALNGMIDKIEFIAKNLTSNAGFCYSLIIQRNKGYFKPFDEMLVFNNKSTEEIKMNHLKTLIYRDL